MYDDVASCKIFRVKHQYNFSVLYRLVSVSIFRMLHVCISFLKHLSYIV
jgi:hypothetical protein